jgi:HSP20 family protein
MREDDMDSKKNEASKRAILPSCSISEDSGVVTVKVEMPGVAKEGLEVKVEGNELSIAGERREEARGKYLLRERRAEPYRKLFTLDDSIERDGMDASLADGILTLKLRVKEAAKPRRIEIA